MLHVEASPRKERSASIEAATAHIEYIKKKHPNTEVRKLDVWNTQLPEFTGHIMDAKYAGLSGTQLSPAQNDAWAQIQELAALFFWADHIVFSIPLWNFGVPYKLKHLIDVISQKDILFSVTDDGLKGLLEEKKVTAIYARGLNFDADSPTPAQNFDFQKPYMEMWFRFVGINNWESIVIEKTLFGPEVDENARAVARQSAKEKADLFW